ncbi:hypothetical protein [Sphingosinicella sp. CPCC 101087]|uniref:hypothetical protein n=1 Tax=Sphingosinicella sp. CPCC 101087 TaxID=2497754 RepID=UPI00101D3F35|nr:hypothetical protein [Sphingosinicella sp. CPCC 101087]
MELLQGRTIPEVWLKAVRHVDLCPRHQDFDVFLHVREPTVLEADDRAIYEIVDAFFKKHDAYSIHTVAETIFPLDEYMRGGCEAVFEIYPPRIKAIHAARNDKNWGTYAYRLLRQKDRDGSIYNPLKDMVAKIRAHSKYTASFELGMGHPLEEDIPIYVGATDRRRLYGGPCLSHLSVKVYDGAIRLNATYRSHYYVRRLFGNLVGLGRLQYFLASETGLAIGGLTINSTYAKIDRGDGGGCGGHWTKHDVDGLIAECARIQDSVQEQEDALA